MLLGFWLFGTELIHVVSITFTALILTELLMVALTIRTWHGLMMVAEVASIAIYVVSLLVLHDYFGQLASKDGGLACALSFFPASKERKCVLYFFLFTFFISLSGHALL